MQFLHKADGSSGIGHFCVKCRTIWPSSEPHPVRILVKTRNQADSAWQLLVNQWEIDKAQVWLGNQPLYDFARDEDGAPNLLTPARDRGGEPPWQSRLITVLAVAGWLCSAFALGVLVSQQPRGLSGAEASTELTEPCVQQQQVNES